MTTDSKFDLREETLEKYLSDDHPLAKYNRDAVKKFNSYELPEGYDAKLVLDRLYSVYYILNEYDEPIISNNRVVGLEFWDDLNTYLFLIMLLLIIDIHKPKNEVMEGYIPKLEKHVVLAKEIGKLESRIPYHLIIRPEGRYSFKNLDKHLKSIANLKQRILFIIEIQDEYKRHMIDRPLSWGDPIDPEERDFFLKCQLALDQANSHLSLGMKTMPEKKESTTDTADDYITFTDYKRGFDTAFNNFLKDYPDALENEFFENEISQFEDVIIFHDDFIVTGGGQIETGDFNFRAAISDSEYYSAKRILEFLQSEKLKFINNKPKRKTGPVKKNTEKAVLEHYLNKSDCNDIYKMLRTLKRIPEDSTDWNGKMNLLATLLKTIKRIYKPKDMTHEAMKHIMKNSFRIDASLQSVVGAKKGFLNLVLWKQYSKK